MGGYLHRIGQYKAYLGDYEFDMLKDKQPKEFYENLNFIVEIENTKTKELKQIEIPVLGNFIEIEKLRKNYTYKIKNDWSLAKILFETVGKSKTFYAIPYISIYYSEYPTKYKFYYLKTDIFVNPIQLDELYECGEIGCVERKCKAGICFNAKVHKITDLKEYEWLLDNGFSVIWVDKKGNILK